MKIKALKRRAVSAVLLLLLFACTASVGFGLAAGDSQGPNVSFEKRYYVGTKLLLPESSLSYGGKSYEAETVVTYPDGRAYRQNELVLNQLGAYTVEYRALAEGKWIKRAYSFEAIDEPYRIDGENSTVTYGEDTSQYATGITGLNLSLAEGEVFRYNETIDLNALGPNAPFVELFVTPTKGAGVRDAGKLVFRLEDAHDPENYVTIYAQSVDSDGGGDPWWCNTTYVAACAPGQSPTGIEWGPPLKIHADSKWGYPVSYSMYGNRNFQPSVGKEFFSLKMDAVNNCVYGPKGPAGNCIVDLDDRRFFSNIWKGFTTGEAYLSVWAEKYIEPRVELVITKIGTSDIGADVLRDSEPPVIEVDSRGYGLDALPQAAAGKPYPVFSATASDVCAKNLPVTAKVFYNYVSDTRYELPVVNGAFTPERPGLYTIEYTAKDYYGNLATVTAEVPCAPGGGDISVNVTGKVTSGKVGEFVAIGTAAYGGGIGRLETDAYVLFGAARVPLDGGSFRPQSAGTYTVCYEAADFAGQTAEYRYDVTVTENANPVFLENPALPKAFIEGVAYRLPRLSAYDYSAQASVDSRLFVADGGFDGETDGTHTFVANAAGKAKLTYRAETETGFAEKSYEVPVVKAYNGTNVRASALFLASGLNVSSTGGGVRLTRAAAGEAAFTYALPLYSDSFSLRFKADGSGCEITLALRDAIDPAKAILLNFKKPKPNSYAYALYVNGADSGLRADLRGEAAVTYDNASRTVRLGEGSYALPAGDGFTGFGRGGAYFEGSFGGGAGAALTMTALCGQNLGAARDTQAPAVSIDGEYALRYLKGSGVNVYPAAAFDTLSPNAACRVTVTAPDGSLVTAEDGTLLNGADARKAYRFTIEKYGDYAVLYEATDLFGNTARVYQGITAVDGGQPAISLKTQNPNSIALGERLQFSAASAYDEVSGSCEVYYFIVDPTRMVRPIREFQVLELANAFAFTPDQPGEWSVQYFAVDEAGNTAFLEHTVTVA